MAKTTRKTHPIILLAESDVIVRLGLAQHLRACAHTVLEAASAEEAKAILHAGQMCDVLICDPQLGGRGSGFGVAQWVRRYRRKSRVVLAASLDAKAQTVVALCGSGPRAALRDAQGLSGKVRMMLAERSRRMRPRAALAGAKQAPS